MTDTESMADGPSGYNDSAFECSAFTSYAYYAISIMQLYGK